MVTANKYKVSEAVLNQLLSPEHRQHGLTLCESEDIVSLVRYGISVARFSAVGATIQSIRDEADKWLPGNDAVAALVECKGVCFGN